jgi:acetyltransferase EpsM
VSALKKLHIIGAGGLAKELIGYIESEAVRRYSIIGCWADDGFNNPKFANFYKGTISELKANYSQDEFIIVAIANNRIRKSIIEEELAPLNATFESYIHPSCEISPFCEIGVGCFLAPQVILTADCKLGDHTFLNTECVIGHDSVVLDFNCLFPKVEICGDCFIEESCTFGIGSLVLPGIRMKEGSKLDAMSVLRESVSESAMFVGNPAKAVKIFS